jgi:hypothetical protein
MTQVLPRPFVHITSYAFLWTNYETQAGQARDAVYNTITNKQVMNISLDEVPPTEPDVDASSAPIVHPMIRRHSTFPLCAVVRGETFRVQKWVLHCSRS